MRSSTPKRHDTPVVPPDAGTGRLRPSRFRAPPRRRRRPPRRDRRDGGPWGVAGHLPDRSGAARLHAAAHPPDQGTEGDRDRHVHRFLRAVHRPRATGRRLAAVPGPQRGLDGGRPPGLGAGGGAPPRRYWERAGLAGRIELRLGDALTELRAVPAVETFDLAFVDADKTGYAAYVAELYDRMTPNGVVLLDNTLRSGRVLDPESDDDHALVALNAALVRDPRWETVLLPLADGLTVLRKR